VVPNDDRRWLLSTVGTLVGLFAATFAVLWAFGLLDATGTGLDGARLSAVLALVGVMITAAVSVLGLLLKRQADRRLEVERAESERRLEDARKEERQRLRLDAAMRAGQLLESAGSGTVGPAPVAAGLLALTQLDHATLAVALLVDLWSEDRESASDTDQGRGMSPAGTNERPHSVSNETAILVLDAALRSRDANTELVAAELLCRNAWRLDACQSLHWPSSIDGTWIPGLGNKTKLLLFDALVRMTYTSTPNENALRSLVVRLYGISDGDTCPRVKGCIGMLLDAVLPALKAFGGEEFMHGARTVTIEELDVAAAKKDKNPDGMLEKILEDRSETLRDWSRRCTTTVLHTGALGNCEFPSLRDFEVAAVPHPAT
jgi:hypothetical protein